MVAPLWGQNNNAFECGLSERVFGWQKATSYERSSIMTRNSLWGPPLTLVILFFSIGMSAEPPTELALPDGQIVYTDYDDAVLIQLAQGLYQRHRHAEALDACQEALSRNLTDDQAATVKHLLARTYDALPAQGQHAKDTYAQVIREHPAYEKLPEVAYRLGELNICIIPEGTEPNHPAAIECLQLVIRELPVESGDEPNVTYLSLKAHMMLGNLVLQKGRNDDARQYFKTIYDCDINKAVPLPYQQFDNEEEEQEHLVWLRDRIAGMKTRLPAKMVSSCISSDLGLSMQRLSQLQSDYPDDTEIYRMISEVLKKLTEIEQIINQEIANPGP